MSETAAELRAELRGMLRGARDSAAFLADGMPDKAITPGQIALEARHGTPLSFARAVIECVGEISVAEAQAAVNKYRREWEDA